MKKIALFILHSIANYFIQFILAIAIIWLGIPALIPTFKKYSWDIFDDIFSTQVGLGTILISIFFVLIFYILIRKYVFRKSGLKEYGGLLWKVNKKMLQVSSIPYCLKHRAKLVARYISDEEYPYSEYYCPICGKHSTPEVTSYNIDNMQSEAESVILSKYGQ